MTTVSPPHSPSGAQRLAFFAGVGPELVYYHVDVVDCTLSRSQSLRLPQNIQYAWPSPSGEILYVATSEGGSAVPGQVHHLTAVKIDWKARALTVHGPQIPLRARPIHLNRASGMAQFERKSCFVGGENSIAVFAIHQETGEPTLIQNADTHGIHPRTFALDPAGEMLVAAHIKGAFYRKTSTSVAYTPACLSVFRVGPDGCLDFVRKYGVETEDLIYWSGMVACRS